MPVPVDTQTLMDALQQQDGRPLKAKDISHLLGLTADDRSSVREALRQLVAEGQLIQLEGRRFTLPRAGTVLKGTVERKATGTAWFLPDDKKRKDAFLPPSELVTVVDGDRVLCRLEESPKGPIGRL